MTSSYVNAYVRSCLFFFSSRRRHTRCSRDWSSDVCSSDLKDFNVPLLNSEQMYQALRSLGVETQLVIYPGQHHAINKPTYRRDRLQRYLAWYDKYLRP